eukprot:5193840-Pleurochrysis_carterae.AAC.1
MQMLALHISQSTGGAPACIAKYSASSLIFKARLDSACKTFFRMIRIPSWTFPHPLRFVEQQKTPRLLHTIFACHLPCLPVPRSLHNPCARRTPPILPVHRQSFVSLPSLSSQSLPHHCR